MSVKARFIYECGGCGKTAEVETGRLSSKLNSMPPGIPGHDYGTGRWVNERPDAVAHAPEGWMAFDPYTRCCYCPDCVAEIWPDRQPERERA